MKKKGKTRAPVESPLAFEPALERSTVVNQEGVDKIRPALAANSNEWKAVVVWPASWAMVDMATTEIPIHLHALLAGLIPLPLISSTPYYPITKSTRCTWILNPSFSLPSSPSSARPWWALPLPWPCFAISSRFT